jgi:hypothetical protein
VLRREITAALARDILIIPVLVEGATMPSEHTLPSDIAPLARRNALELEDTRWDYDDLTDLGTVQDLGDGQWQRLPARRDDRAAGSHRPGGKIRADRNGSFSGVRFQVRDPLGEGFRSTCPISR